MSIIVEVPAALMSIQDLGRSGYARFGLPESGPMDWWAHRAANRLVGNPPETACLEMGLTAAVLGMDNDALLTVCGAGYSVMVNQRPVPLWTAFIVRRGDRVTLERVPGGNWVYLAVAGGLDTMEWMASHSTNPRAGLGKTLTAGDILQVGQAGRPCVTLAGSLLPKMIRPKYQNNPVIRAVPGPHTDRFTPDSLAIFWASDYLLTTRSDRMGFRLNGTALGHTRGADLISQGMALGEVQVPGDGQPIVMMPDHPTTGGYACVAAVIRCDLPLLAQAPPGESRICFETIEPSQAQELLRVIVHQIDTGIMRPDEEWLQW